MNKYKLKPKKGKFLENNIHPELLGTAILGQKGQVVIPSSIRRFLGLSTGDKLLVMVKSGTLCMIKAEMLQGFINQLTKQLGKLKNNN